MYEIYTDGSCLGNPGPGGVGIVVLKDNKVIAELSFNEPDTTNNRMELTATIAGIGYVREMYSATANIKVYTDSNYVVSGMNTWRHSWKKNNWSKCKKNLDLWKILDDVGDDCSYVYVKAHAGIVYNELANDLAQNAAKELK